jgi:HKD family nuclease
LSRGIEPRLQLIDNRLDEQTLASHLRRWLGIAHAAYIHVAYLRDSGVALVRDAVAEMVGRGGKLRVLAGGDFAQTEPDALRFFRDLRRDCQVKLLSSSGIGGFHPKCYLLYTQGDAALVVGSSNFTGGGLQGNIELNLQAVLPSDHASICRARSRTQSCCDGAGVIIPSSGTRHEGRPSIELRFAGECGRACRTFLGRRPAGSVGNRAPGGGGCTAFSIRKSLRKYGLASATIKMAMREF